VANQCLSWYTTLKILESLGFKKVSVSLKTYNEIKK